MPDEKSRAVPPHVWGPTLVGRLNAHAKGDRMRVKVNPRDGYCWALIDLGATANRRLGVHCSSRSRDGMFCGRHDHFWTVLGAEDARDYIARHGGRLTTNDSGEIVLYEAPSRFRKTPKVVPFDDSSPSGSAE